MIGDERIIMYSIVWKINGKSLYMCKHDTTDQGVRVEFLPMEFLGGKRRTPKNLIRVDEATAAACIEELLEQDKGREYKAVRV